MNTVVALAILLVSILCTRLSGMVPAWRDLQERDPVFFFEAFEAMKKMLFRLGSVNFGERD